MRFSEEISTEQETWLTVHEASDVSGVSPRTMRRYIQKGDVIFQKVRGRRRHEYRIAKSSLDNLAQRQGIGNKTRKNNFAQNHELVPKFLYDEIREENKRLFVRVRELEQELTALRNEHATEKNTARLKQELIEKENLIQLLESTITIIQKS